MSSTAMQQAIKLQLKFIGCIAYRCGYASFIIYFTIIHKIFVILFANYNYSYYICTIIIN